MLTSCPSAGKTVGRVRTSNIRPGFKKPLRPIFSEAPPSTGGAFLCSISSPKHAARNSHPPSAVQRRPPRTQSGAVGSRELPPVRKVQQPQLAWPQLHARRLGRGRNRSEDGLCLGPLAAQEDSRARDRGCRRSQELQSRRAIHEGNYSDVGEPCDGVLENPSS